MLLSEHKHVYCVCVHNQWKLPAGTFNRFFLLSSFIHFIIWPVLKYVFLFHFDHRTQPKIMNKNNVFTTAEYAYNMRLLTGDYLQKTKQNETK